MGIGKHKNPSGIFIPRPSKPHIIVHYGIYIAYFMPHFCTIDLVKKADKFAIKLNKKQNRNLIP